MSMSTKEKVTVNPTNEKEERNMANAFDDEMDLRDDAQIEAEENEKKELAAKKSAKVGFVKQHKTALIIGGVVVGVAAVGLGLWGVSNIGRGRTFFGGRKYNGRHGHGHHGRYNYNIDRMTTPEIPATGAPTIETVKVVTPMTTPMSESDKAVVDLVGKLAEDASKNPNLKVKSI